MNTSAIYSLVERFHQHHHQYRSSKYKETPLRREFVDPFLEALGWDVSNTEGRHEAFKQVIHEDSIVIDGRVKAPDYTLTVSGQRKLFVEAKRPTVNIKDSPHPAFQIRHYAWNAKLPLSVLTDFQELAIYDCRDRPSRNDSAQQARIEYLTYEEYVDKWDDIVSLLSRDAIEQGSLEQYARENKTKRGTAEVDKAFLAEMSIWREQLALNMALRNPLLNTRQLNHAVQSTIDRIVFLRIAEDRGIEPYGRLREVTRQPEIYSALVRLFLLADAKYNSGLFHFKPEKGRDSSSLDTFTLSLNIDDEVLKAIIKRLYYPDSPYQFDVIPADILGQVYEQFLGKVICLTSSGQAVVEDKPEVIKAGGVYYTPTSIVDYIVKQTVGQLLEGRTPGPNGSASELRFLDPAAGSGSFLLSAYQYLLNWHLEQYVKSPNKWSRGKAPTICLNDRGEWRLTISERKRILLNNIYGVDIDSQAVEVTKLSLLLKVMEGENEQTLGAQMRLLPERVLPDLSANIQCGNSLIGADYYEGEQLSLGILAEEEMYRVNIFDWGKAFPHIVPCGGFDAVIGNPPYIQSRSEMMIEKDKDYYTKHYKTAQYQLNTYGLFVEKSISLLKDDALVGMIIPNYWLSTGADSLLRQHVFIDNSVREITNVYRVFSNATVDTLILILKRTTEIRFPKCVNVRAIDRNLKAIPDRLQALANSQWGFDKDFEITPNQTDVEISFSEPLHLKGEKLLSDYLSFKFGMKPYQVGKGKPAQTRHIVKNKIFNSDRKLDEDYMPLLFAKGVKRYSLAWQGEWIRYGEHLAEPRSLDLFEGERILIRRIVSKTYVEGVITAGSYICNTDVITLRKIYEDSFPDLRFFLGILLSRPFAVFLRSQNVNLDRAAFPKINTNTLATLPVPNLVTTDLQTKQLHDKLVKAVAQILELNERLEKAQTAHERNIVQRQITVTDNQIDDLVCQLYNLNQGDYLTSE